MPSYTAVDLEVLIHEQHSHQIARLDDWVKTAPGYNAPFDCDLRPGIYPYDPHPFFISKDAFQFLSPSKNNIDAKYPAWCYNQDTRILEIHALLKQDWSLTLHFLEWLSPLTERVIDSDFTHPMDLDGPRHINLVDGKLEIATFSYTR